MPLSTIIALAVLLFIIRIVTVILHELGHAIPAIIFTQQSVSIYIGSFGKRQKGLKIKIGLLEVWLSYNPLTWYHGFCMSNARFISINQEIAYLLMGPVTSLFIALFGCLIVFALDFHGAVKLAIVSFALSAFVDLVTNLSPRNTPTTLKDGTHIYNDGYQIILLLRKKYKKKSNNTVEYFDSN